MQFLIPLEVVEFDQSAATRYGAIRSDLESSELVIGSMDMLIAAHASWRYTGQQQCTRVFTHRQPISRKLGGINQN